MTPSLFAFKLSWTDRSESFPSGRDTLICSLPGLPFRSWLCRFLSSADHFLCLVLTLRSLDSLDKRAGVGLALLRSTCPDENLSWNDASARLVTGFHHR